MRVTKVLYLVIKEWVISVLRILPCHAKIEAAQLCISSSGSFQKDCDVIFYKRQPIAFKVSMIFYVDERWRFFSQMACLKKCLKI